VGWGVCGGVSLSGIVGRNSKKTRGINDILTTNPRVEVYRSQFKRENGSDTEQTR
jgi:hypothetical protein